MDFKLLKEKLEELKQPSWREKQIRQAFFVGLAGCWEEVTVLPKNMREELAGVLSWSSLKLKKEVVSKDGTVKAVFELADKNIIESVLISHDDGRQTVCVSSQVGCPIGCAFCATGKIGFKRNLEAEEIVDQVLWFARALKKKTPLHPPYQGGNKVTNVVFMGMGEPFLNYQNVITAIKKLNDTEGFNLGARHMSISTAGIVDGIKKLSDEKLQVNLALSLHAPNDKLRDQFIPINKKYNIKQVLRAIDNYIEKTNRRVMIEYLMIDKVNDSPEQARELAELMKERKLCYLNLIPYNPTGPFKSSRPEVIEKFGEILKKERIAFTIRRRFGEGAAAACGQLAGKN